jgi:hypothetical protein
MDSLTGRRARHDRVAALLAAAEDAELVSALGAAPAETVGIGGGSAVLDVGGTPVFAKRIPVSEREMAAPHRTADPFGLPVFCQYGLGGPSFSVWRELAANQIVTEGVLSGDTEFFPLLHHWRVLPGRAEVADEHRDIDAAVALNGGSAAVRMRLEEQAGAPASLVLFSEYLPLAMPGPLSPAETERQLFEAVAFLRGRELLHMDAHFGNLRSDGERLYLTDFGLATSPRFELSAAEREFVAAHVGYDAAYAAMRLVNWLVVAVCGIPLPAGGGPVERNAYVRRCAAGDLRSVPAPVAGILARHAPAAARMNDLWWKLFDGDLNAGYSP